MRRLFIIIPVVIIAVIGLLLMLKKPSVATAVPSTIQQGMPWQIELVDGTSRVFGLTLGKSRLADAVSLVGTDFELAILSRPGQPEALELFTSNFKSGSLRGSLILVMEVSAAEIQQLRKQFGLRQEHLETGATKTTLRFEQQQAVMLYPIKSIMFLPVARLDKSLVEQRFGSAYLTQKISEKETSYLYPDRGLNIIIDEKGKDLIQYVSPDAFSEVQGAVQAQADSYANSGR